MATKTKKSGTNPKGNAADERKKKEAENRASGTKGKEHRQTELDKRRSEDEAHAAAKAAETYAPGSLGRLENQAPIDQVAAPEAPGMISTTMEGGAQSIAESEQHYTDAQQRDQYVQDALTRMQAGLGGYTPEEQQAQRENAARQVKSQTATDLRSLRAANGEAGVTGRSAIAGQSALLNNQRQVIGGQETQLIANNAAEQRARLGDYAGYANTAYGTHAAIVDQALGRLTGARQNVADYTLKAAQGNQSTQASTADRALSLGRLNTDINEFNSTNATNTALTNLGQAEKEKTGNIGVYYGDQGISQALRNQIIQEELAKRAQKQASA